MITPDACLNQLELPHCSLEQLEERLRAGNVWAPFTVHAIEQAIESHGTKIRDSGKPYLEEHVYPIAADALDYMVEKGAPAETKKLITIGALLHDTVEDDPDFDLERCEERFGLPVTRLVYPLTKIGVNHDIYIRKLENASDNVKIIKIIDRLNNLQCSVVLCREFPDKPDKLVKYLAETESSYVPLANMLIDKTLLKRLQKIVALGHSALNNSKNSL